MKTRSFKTAVITMKKMKQGSMRGNDWMGEKSL